MVVVIVGQQRSGTTVLGRTLSRAGGYAYLGEVFHKGTLSDVSNYFGYRVEALRNNPHLSLPSRENLDMLWDGFLAQAHNHFGKQHILMDVKYNSFHHLNPFYHPISAQPYLMKMLNKRKATFVHVRRESLFAQACSALLAERRGQFHSDQPRRHDVELPIEVDPDILKTRMMVARSQEERYSALMKSCNRVIEVTYPHFIEAEGISEEAAVTLASIVEPQRLIAEPIPLKKISPEPHRIVANRDAVLQAFSGTHFAEDVRIQLRG